MPWITTHITGTKVTEMGKVFINRREGERRIGERRDFSPEGLKLQQRRLEGTGERRLHVERRHRERRLQD
jgi:hypothetical protein